MPLLHDHHPHAALREVARHRRAGRAAPDHDDVAFVVERTAHMPPVERDQGRAHESPAAGPWAGPAPSYRARTAGSSKYAKQASIFRVVSDWRTK